MRQRVLEEKLKEYSITGTIDQENVLQELVQQYVLAGLARAGFFASGQAVFHGGTCLRIIYGMSRFSEDLDFFLKRPDPDFRWGRYLAAVGKDATGEGFRFSVQDKSGEAGAVKKAMIRAESIGRFPPIDLPFERDLRKLIKVKLEIDVNPPLGSSYETRYLAFPVTAALTTQSLASGFAMKIGAMLGRTYTKGRDWYDFIWYVNRRTVPDLVLLSHALDQQGPWAGQRVEVDAGWVETSLRKRIAEVDWAVVRRDVERFLPLREQEALKLWGRDLFLQLLGVLMENLAEGS
ncbi:MAG: nucleotidyl transferase AbiEii/AbiGii toxin family protein [Candidatus Aminicenantes bacterium]|nr:nucleotidyl transferase AbiEii/AbiGii toxin family protein [Candidatus Aminicenantes bacterium]